MNPVHDPPLPPLGPKLDFLRLLWQVDHALQRSSKRMSSKLGVTGPQRLVLRILGRFPGLPAGEVAGLLHLHPSTISGVLQRLERRGWIKRRSDPKDGRRALFGLTQAGRAFDSTDPMAIEAAIGAVLARADERETDVARRILQELANELERGGVRA